MVVSHFINYLDDCCAPWFSYSEKQLSAACANKGLWSLLCEQLSITQVILNAKPVQSPALQGALVCPYWVPGTQDSKASSGVFLFLEGLLRPAVIISSDWLHYRLCNQCVFFVNQTGCNSCPSAAAEWNGLLVLQGGVLDKSDVSNGKYFKWWFWCPLNLRKLILEIINLNWWCDVSCQFNLLFSKACLSPGRGLSFSVPVVFLPVSTLTGSWGAGDRQASLKPLSLIREPSLISHHGADCTRQAVCPCDVLVLAGWDK